MPGPLSCGTGLTPLPGRAECADRWILGARLHARPLAGRRPSRPGTPPQHEYETSER